MSRAPSFGEALEAAFSAQLGQLRSIEPGEVTSWNRDEQTATVQPLILGPGRAARAAIPRCAVVFPGACWDIQVGETGLLLVCDADYHRWWRDDEAALPATTASHSIGSSVFLPGLRSLAGARGIPFRATVLECPIAAGIGRSVRLGVWDADRAALHENLLNPLRDFYTALNAWGALVEAALPPGAAPWAPVLATLNALLAGIAGGSYRSSSVMVED